MAFAEVPSGEQCTEELTPTAQEYGSSLQFFWEYCTSLKRISGGGRAGGGQKP